MYIVYFLINFFYSGSLFLINFIIEIVILHTSTLSRLSFSDRQGKQGLK
jgi:hypothetical protein